MIIKLWAIYKDLIATRQELKEQVRNNKKLFDANMKLLKRLSDMEQENEKLRFKLDHINYSTDDYDY